MGKNLLYGLGCCLIGFAFCLSCASPKKPSGGSIRKVAPKVIATYPPDTALTNFTGKEVVFLFDRWIDFDKKGVKIYPKVKDYEIYAWGKEIRVSILDTLIDDQTYIINLPASIQDYRSKEKMDSPFQLAFSTGDKIDSGYVSGEIMLNDNIKEPIIIAYFLGKDSLKAEQNDSLNPLKTEPFYVSQVSKDGSFSLDYLKEGFYFVFGADDQNKNFKYDSTEAFAVKQGFLGKTQRSVRSRLKKKIQFDIEKKLETINDSSNQFSPRNDSIKNADDSLKSDMKNSIKAEENIVKNDSSISHRDLAIASKDLRENLKLRFSFPYDTLATKVSNAKAQDKNHVSIFFDRILGYEYVLDRDSMVLYDTASKEDIKIFDFVSKKSDSKTEVILWLDDTLNSKKVYSLSVLIKTKKGRMYYDTTTFIGSSLDEEQPMIIFIEPFKSDVVEDALGTYELSPFGQDTAAIPIEYTAPFGREKIKRAVKLFYKKEESLDTLDIDYAFTSGAKVFIKPKASEFKQGETYVLKIDSIQVDTSTSISEKEYTLEIVKPDLLGGIEGKITIAKEVKEVLVALKRKEDGFTFLKKFYRKDTTNSISFSFKSLVEGEYSLEAFVPLKGTAIWDGGNVYPFRPSAPFAIYQGEAKVRKRWVIDNVHLELK